MNARKIAGRDAAAHRQDQRLLGDQRHRREIAGGVVGRLEVHQLHLGVRRFTAEQQLIAVGIGTGDARRAGHAAGAGHILDDDLLAEESVTAPRHRPGPNVS